MLLLLITGMFMAWAIGANDSAKAVGTAVGSGVLNFKQSIILIALFTTLGAFIGGSKVAHTVGGTIIPVHNMEYISIALFSSALAVTLASLKALPISTTQSVIGALIGVGIARGSPVNWYIISKIALAWIISPIAAGVLAICVLKVYGRLINDMKSIKTIELTYQGMIILSASYTAFNLGANELSNVIGIIAYGSSLKGWLIKGLMSFGLILGALTFSYSVIRTIGRELTSLGPLSAFSSQFGSSMAVTIANAFGLPVSSGQSVVGGILGVGMLKGERINRILVRNIIIGWIMAPVVSCLLTLTLLTLLE